MTSDVILIILSSILMLLAIAGCFLPVLPGPPLGYLSLLALHFTHSVEFSTQFLLIWVAVVLAVTVLEYLIPIWGTKKFGGSKAGNRGAAIGLIVGIFIIPPLGMIGGTIAGAIAGEIIANPNDVKQALQSALGALVGFLMGMVLKLAVTLVMAFYLLKELFQLV